MRLYGNGNVEHSDTPVRALSSHLLEQSSIPFLLDHRDKLNLHAMARRNIWWMNIQKAIALVWLR